MTDCKGLEKNLEILSADEQTIAQKLVDLGQAHLFQDWPDTGVQDADKHRLLSQLADLDIACSGGLAGYISRAKVLLENSKSGVNPYENWIPTVPEGVVLSTEDKEGRDVFDSYESKGMNELGHCAFVLVAGGLGERLGYNGIKIALPTEIITETCYLDLYIRNILAIQDRARERTGNPDLVCPLAIMVSKDTDTKTRQLLEDNNYFGMEKKNITLMKQKANAPCLVDNDAHLALSSDDPFEIMIKPHGHGDVHTLLYENDLPAQWDAQGVKWVVFFQDTNGQVFRALPAAVGVSADLSLAVNSVTVARKPGEAVGAICRLSSEDDKHMTINVEYNQLDPLLKASNVDEVAPDSPHGYSKFPGNINVLVFDNSIYKEELKKSEGIIAEFVNPKYKDDTKTVFKKPTRLECMMQDYPKTLGPQIPVGFTQFERWVSFSACKNKIEDARAKQAKTGYAESGASAEADYYFANRKLLSFAGVDIDVDGEDAQFSGIKIKQGARVVLMPRFGPTQAEIRSKIDSDGKISISNKSSLVLDGKDITIKNLELDGNLRINAVDGAQVTVDNAKVRATKWWSFTGITTEEQKDVDERYQIRGYRLDKNGDEGTQVSVDRPGVYTVSIKDDGTVLVTEEAQSNL